MQVAKASKWEKLTLEARFWRRVEKHSIGCWFWIGNIAPNGYGFLSTGARGLGNTSAHRLSYKIHHGPIPQGKLVMHRCDVRHCVRPDHLCVGTHRDNTIDAVRKGRWPVQSGEASPSAILTWTQVRKIRNLVAEGAMQKSAARKFRVSKQLVSAIINNKRWRS